MAPEYHSKSLAVRLAAVRAEADRRLPPGVHPVHIAVGDRLGRMSFPNALRRGDRAPDFELESATGGKVGLAEVLTGGPVVLVFYRGAWCPYCNSHLRAYQEVLPAFSTVGATVIAISPQTRDHTVTTRELNELGFAVLSDPGNRVAERYGVAFDVDDQARRDAMEPRGVDLPRFNGENAWRLPAPATFVINVSGEIVISHVDGDFRRRLEPADALVALGVETSTDVSDDAVADGRRSLDISFEVRGVDLLTGEMPVPPE